jgi:hypothetical protein
VAQEEDFILGADGKPRWAIRRQSAYHIVKQLGSSGNCMCDFRQFLGGDVRFAFAGTPWFTRSRGNAEG